MFDALYEIANSDLRELASLCERSVSPDAPTRRALGQLVGEQRASSLFAFLQLRVQEGWTMQQIGELCRAVANAPESQSNRPFDLVLSGPDVQGSPTRDTQAVMQALLAEAKHEVLLVGYVIHKAQDLFRPLAAQMERQSDLKVWACLDVQRKWNDARSDDDILSEFADQFVSNHWPWKPLPTVFYDPRSLHASGNMRSSLHAKCIVIDRRIALITSANFTEAAQQRNIEAGVLIRDSTFAERLSKYFDGLLELRLLRPVVFEMPNNS